MSFSVPPGRFVSLRLLSASTAKQVVHLISNDERQHCRRPDAGATGQAQQIGASGRIAIDFPQANLQLRMLRGELREMGLGCAAVRAAVTHEYLKHRCVSEGMSAGQYPQKHQQSPAQHDVVHERASQMLAQPPAGRWHMVCESTPILDRPFPAGNDL